VGKARRRDDDVEREAAMHLYLRPVPSVESEDAKAARYYSRRLIEFGNLIY
jgi:hypothetical protein